MDVYVNRAFQAAALARASLVHAGDVLSQVAPQFAAQAARLIEAAINNARGKYSVSAVVAPELERMEGALAFEGQNKGIGLESAGPGEDAPQKWGSLNDIEFDLLSGPTGLSAAEGGENYAQHAIIGGHPRLQWTGRRLQKVPLRFAWHSATTPDLDAKLEALLAAMRNREVLDLVIGENSMGSVFVGQFVIESIPVVVTKQRPGDMGILAAEVTVNLLEWAEAPDLVATGAQPKGITKPDPTPAQAAQSQKEFHRDDEGYFRQGRP